MNLMLFRSLWTNGFDLDAAIADCRAGAFDGVEGPVGADGFVSKLRDSGVPFIAEITTGGGYVPEQTASFQDHLESLHRKLEASVECEPVLVTVLAGSDCWAFEKNVEFFGRAMEIARTFGVPASFETHRSRSMFNPWVTRDLLAQLPDLKLTCDFSHWCCVCERLVMDGEAELLATCAERAAHVHARVGYEQGPQVPHPGAPEWREALKAHERWWEVIWDALESQGAPAATMTPEFGPDGYLQTLPFGGEPVADLDDVNHWMATRQRARFTKRKSISYEN